MAPLAAALLPRPLDAVEAERIAHVWTLRTRGRLTAAEQEAAELGDSLLIGHVLADLYLARGTRPDPETLRAWLARYADHPEAPAIYDLLLTRMAQKPVARGAAGRSDSGAPLSAAPLPPAPVVRALGRGGEYRPPLDPPEPGDGARVPPSLRRPAFEQVVDRRVDAGDGAGALNLIGQAKGLDPAYAAQQRGRVVQRLFLRGNDEAAVALAAGMLSGAGASASFLTSAAPAEKDFVATIRMAGFSPVIELGAAASGKLKSSLTGLGTARPVPLLSQNDAVRAVLPEGTGLAGFAGGLAAWRAGRIEAAAILFEAAWATSGTPRDIRVAGAFWAARAHMRLDDGPSYLVWMRRAAAHPLDFYGMIARRSLGMDDGFLPPARPDLRTASAGRNGRTGAGQPMPGQMAGQMTLGEADVAAVDATPAGHRAFALLQIGQPARAEVELRCLWEAAADNLDLRRSLLLVTRRAGLTAAAAQMADALPKPEAVANTSGAVDSGPYPVPPLVPLNGYVLPPALVYGVTLQESAFDPSSISSTGARGLMQLMPGTAVEVAGDPSLAGADIERLHDPMLNLDLGQRFLIQLGRMPALDGDLIRILASYYSGPAAVAKWAPDVLARSAAGQIGDDPLLFLESIPADDVRGYARRGLTFAWIYAARFGMPAPGLDDLVAGRFPRFVPLATPQTFLPPHLRP